MKGRPTAPTDRPALGTPSSDLRLQSIPFVEGNTVVDNPFHLANHHPKCKVHMTVQRFVRDSPFGSLPAVYKTSCLTICAN